MNSILDLLCSSIGSLTNPTNALPNDDKIETENKPFALTGDSFPKIIVCQDTRKRWYDDNGIFSVGILDFLLDQNIV